MQPADRSLPCRLIRVCGGRDRYLAGHVSAVSRVRGIRDEDGIWLSGVQPGGIAAGRQDLWEARASFRRAFVGVLADIASSVGDFSALQMEVAQFLEERDDRAFEDWTVAVDANRREPLDWAQMQQLPIMPAGVTSSMTVARSEQVVARSCQIGRRRRSMAWICDAAATVRPSR